MSAPTKTLGLPRNPVKRLCTCNACGGTWVDLPGILARLSRYGCPTCGSLYWTEAPHV